MKEYVAVVNEKDKVIGRKSREEVMKNLLIHRGAAILVFNKKKKY